jgi:membrane associated rhomboid family serine protease
MREASVGFQCPSCVAEGSKAVRAPRTLAGGALPSRAGRVSIVIIAINVVVFALTYVARVDGVTAAGAMSAYGLSADGTVYPGVVGGGYWRLLTSAFLHAGLLHILFNMYALYLFGPFAEKALGTRRFIAAYVTMAVVSSVFVFWLSSPVGYTVGASGAVFGLFGMALVLLVRAGQDVRFLLMLLAVNVFIGFQASISWQAHLGGFLAGATLALAASLPPRERRVVVQRFVYAGLWLAVVAAVVVRTAMLT